LIPAAPLFELRQHPRQQRAKAVPVQEAGKRQQSGPAGNFLVGEADLDGFIGCWELDEFGHCLVSRSVG
jgi:hypothetical protein